MAKYRLKYYILLILIAVLPLAISLTKGEPFNNNNKEKTNNFLEVFEKILSNLEQLIKIAVNRALKFVLTIARAIYILMAAVGVLLWATSWSPTRGKQLILGAIIIMILVEYLSTVIK
ncbi:MAG: hypothetical protein DRJ52_03495 [Thermoprotei archaeon]|nr:MAG: hypothetical protein DRJ52_03495 [Thermoprotei archaeon]RLE99827.1 MAG: hypothetical protein DRJ63_04130 [Thermoprotei archaeon]